MLIKQGFTLVELIIVIVILGILVTLAIPAYRNTQERALDKEAASSLRTIQAAEKIYYMEIGAYYDSTGASALDHIKNLNTSLKLSLPQGNNRNWNYETNANGCAKAARNQTDGRTFSLTVSSDDDPLSPANCP
ncbi:MAG: prepilin-type N-terminal cleavage/methylation domain-containing protein [Candidatus Omnitrophota bacterium]|jgi:prepilin-type N-terminal cleavage/methylation domain-containing protein